ncbi:MAG: radical SAM family heme chaperone HemW [Candidatus Omnitrophica bacterium]|nr:radical SAM family heme chaperone HemW [Candidatus Omnitrophota bacterium]
MFFYEKLRYNKYPGLYCTITGNFTKIKMRPLLYIHIPFCDRGKCAYCDFYSVPYEPRQAAALVESYGRELRMTTSHFRTIYIGGGTPSVLSRSAWATLLNACRRHASGAEEWTVEMNPEHVTGTLAHMLKESGVNRISLGVQSFCRQKLRCLGRRHSPSQAAEAVNIVRKAGIQNVSIDLLFGVWEESLKEWRRELAGALTLPLTHLSLYALTYERDTLLGRRLSRGDITPLADDIVAEQYLAAADLLRSCGFVRYEISNFARPGRECLHNLGYWQGFPYLGIGPSAVSFLNGVRMRRTAEVSRYLALDGGAAAVCEREKLPPAYRAREAAAVLIRTSQGIDFAAFRRRYGYDLLNTTRPGLQELVGAGILEWTGSPARPTGVRLTSEGFLRADTASSALLSHT